jgi:ubiquinone/menaquinone biosynthesis C-methylase UbiE
LTFLESLLRLFFRHLYTTAAPAYDLVAWVVSLGQWQDWRRAAQPCLRAGRTLELGPGPGRSLAELSCLDGPPPMGIELSSQMVRLAARRLRRLGFPIRVVQGRSQALPLPPEIFDNVLSTFPTPYILDPGTLAEVRRVLRPGGHLVVIPFAVPAGPLPWDRMGAWLFRFTGQAQSTQEQWQVPFEAAGFATVLETLNTRRAEVVRLIAEKPAAGTPIAPSHGGH